jgi:putative DNA primase/helicase
MISETTAALGTFAALGVGAFFLNAITKATARQRAEAERRREDAFVHAWMQYYRDTGVRTEPLPPYPDTGTAAGASPMSWQSEAPLFVPASSMRMETQEWVWPGVIASGDLTLLAGAPGMGKTQVACYAAATVSRGAAWPDGAAAKRGSVIFCETEDRPSQTILPRLHAAGADVSKIEFGEHMDLSASMGMLAAQASTLPDLRLIVLSPVLTFFGKTSNDDNTVRTKLRPLLEWAAARRIAVLGVIHPPKSGPANVFAGSDAYRRACRAAWQLVVDPNDPEPDERRKGRLMVAAKANNAPDTMRLAYRIEGVRLLPSGIVTSRIRWHAPSVGRPSGGTSTPHDDGACPTPQDVAAARSALATARAWLECQLANGAMDSGEIKRAATSIGIAEVTLYRAAESLGVAREDRPGLQTKLWTLP